ncbi:MAG TPA: hypothetical protein VHH36_08975 [Candidatus Thermoplasmatota archaeon]|nr:hypothetical protein [Candidatus Thermoplasmatota archaeon]
MVRIWFVMISSLLCLMPFAGMAGATHDVMHRLPKVEGVGAPTTDCWQGAPVVCLTAVAKAAVACSDSPARHCAAVVYGGVVLTDVTGEFSGHAEYTFIGNLGAEGEVTAVTGGGFCDFKPGDGGCTVGNPSTDAVDICYTWGCHAEGHADIWTTAWGDFGIQNDLVAAQVGKLAAFAQDHMVMCLDDSNDGKPYRC